jgi:DNA-binding NarL/FixJ family response regulator
LTSTARLLHRTPSIVAGHNPRLLIVEDHPLFCAALVDVIRMAFPDAEIRQATSIKATMELIAAGAPIDLILLDLSLPGTTGLLGAIRVRTAAPKSALVIVSAYDNPRVVGSAMSLGVSGFVPKSTSKSELAELIRGILGGSVCVPTRLINTPVAKQVRAEAQALLCELSVLTPQQLCVLDMICCGLQNKQIAYELNISITTVKVHVTEVLRKLHVRNRTEAIIKISLLDLNRADTVPASTVVEE